MIWESAVLYFLGMLGLGGGVVLALIAPEEILPGKKYLQMMQSSLLGILFVVGTFILAYSQLWISLVVYVVLFITVMGLAYVRRRIPHEIYFVCIIPFIQTSFAEVFAVILFLYGLPTGTFLWAQKKILKKR